MNYREKMLRRKDSILKRRTANTIYAKEARKRNWTANVQSLYDTYLGELTSKNPRALPRGGVDHYKRRIMEVMQRQKSALESEGTFRDPQHTPLY